tara:strand:+ start:16926 stop:17732 length:807 start_codon:yes stop_codon:yes gene_type:complete
MSQPEKSPTTFCTAFVKYELSDYRQKEIYMSSWSAMSRMIERANELSSAYDEIIKAFGYSSKQQCSSVWLLLELIWSSSDFSRGEVENARYELVELNSLSSEIEALASKLAYALERQSEIYNRSGFCKNDYQSSIDMIFAANEDNYLFRSHVADKLRSLQYQYDLKYWPSRADVVRSIEEFESVQPEPLHSEYPEAVLKGRASDIKNFVLAFDAAIDEPNGLPTGFRFTNNSMAGIINVILDLPVDKLATGDAVRVVRNRYSFTKSMI